MTKTNPHSCWPERDPELRELWAWRDEDGRWHTVVRIGTIMKLTKWKVRSRARQIGLPTRDGTGVLVPPVRTYHRPPKDGIASSIIQVGPRHALVRLDSQSPFKRMEITEDFGLPYHAPSVARRPPEHPAPTRYHFDDRPQRRPVSCEAIKCENRAKAGKSFCDEHCRRFYISERSERSGVSNLTARV